MKRLELEYEHTSGPTHLSKCCIAAGSASCQQSDTMVKLNQMVSIPGATSPKLVLGEKSHGEKALGQMGA
jgi:hypothetical protein